VSVNIDFSALGFDTTVFMVITVVQENLLPTFSELRMDMAGSCEMPVTIYQTQLSRLATQHCKVSVQ
jgi:hypothetical protein